MQPYDNVAPLASALRAVGAVEDAALRCTAAYDSLAGSAGEIVIFGAGPLGKIALGAAKKAGLEVFAFADNDLSKQGRTVSEVGVISPQEAVSRFSDRAAFVVAIFNGTAARNQLRDLGCPRVVPFPVFYWRFPDAFANEVGLELPHRILQQVPRINLGYECLSDELSRREYAAQIQWRCSLDYDCLPPHAPAEETHYDPGLIRLTSDEVFVDCGAFDGDSIRAFLKRTDGAFAHICAIEPDPQNRTALECCFRPLIARGSLSVLACAVGDENHTVSFAATGTAGSRITGANGTMALECRRLDDLLNDVTPTFIKFDIEGAEPRAIAGAGEMIRRAHPILAVCAYHSCSHLWTLPVLMKEALPEYKIFLRRYAEECWETVYYAIPPERLR